ncbi:toprim domain-containing protein [Lignipirellula cremea]|uniref:Toprim domain-containing protein n=1 Tax=Lignipirellula cremea TaxID=2528010 RepID=A0A518DTM5_9BACT|nr:hypothetical protein [Lignipirellula cremea]QDU95189.1 hypothetical protein Pla8534_30010 [Lignipirellula cremea]
MRRDTPWRRVTRAERCPICDKPDWCLVNGPTGNPTEAICARNESDKIVKSDKGLENVGWLHRLQVDDAWRPQRVRTVRVAPPAPTAQSDLTALAERSETAIGLDALGRLADSLGLSVASLQRLGVGWSAEHGATTWPMRDVTGVVLGIRLRLASGRKFAVRGGHEGLFLPRDLPDGGVLLICEGPTDTAAMVELGFAAVGRPNCTGGVRLLVDLVRCRSAGEVVIVADIDPHGAGRRGADSLAAVLVAYSTTVRVIEPGIGKDAREWLQRGGTRADVLTAIDAAPVRQLLVQTRKVGPDARR